MLADIRRAFSLIDRADLWRWAALVPLAVVVGGLEALGAGAVFVLVRILADPAHIDRLPAPLNLLPHGGDPRAAALTFTAYLVLFYIARNATLVAIHAAEEHVVHRSADRIATSLLARYLYAPYPFHFHRTSAALVQNLRESVDMVVEMVLTSIVHITSEALVVAALMTLLVLTAPVEMASTVAITLVLLATPLGVTRRLYARWGEEEREAGERLLTTIHQSLDTVKDIAVAGRQRYFVDRFAAEHGRMRRLRVRRGTGSTALRLAVETVFICAMLLAVAMLVAANRSGSEIVSVLGLFAYAGFRVVPSTNRILLNANSLRYGRAYVEPLLADWLALRDVSTEPAAAGEWPPLARALVFERVSYTYDDGREAALTDVDLTIARGESIGIVGPTGAGKSTLVDVMLGLLTPSAGRVLADGRPIHDALRAWQAQIGYVPQQIMLVDDTLRRNIAFGIDDDRIDEARVARAVRTARLDALVAGLPQGLDSRVGERGVRLSGGERQRIAIARALYGDPAVLVFDEATSALDSQTEREIAAAIDAVRGERTVVVIAHRLTTVQHCDRLVVLEHGRVVAEGRYADVLEGSELFRALVAQTVGTDGTEGTEGTD